MLSWFERDAAAPCHLSCCQSISEDVKRAAFQGCPSVASEAISPALLRSLICKSFTVCSAECSSSTIIHSHLHLPFSRAAYIMVVSRQQQPRKALRPLYGTVSATVRPSAQAHAVCCAGSIRAGAGGGDGGRGSTGRRPVRVHRPWRRRAAPPSQGWFATPHQIRLTSSFFFNHRLHSSKCEHGHQMQF